MSSAHERPAGTDPKAPKKTRGSRNGPPAGSVQCARGEVDQLSRVLRGYRILTADEAIPTPVAKLLIEHPAAPLRAVVIAGDRATGRDARPDLSYLQAERPSRRARAYRLIACPIIATSHRRWAAGLTMGLRRFSCSMT